MKRVLSFGVAALSALLLAVSAGCGGGSNPYDVVEISGTLTYEGRPVGDVGLIFTPEEGRPSQAITDAEGKFKLFYSQSESGAQVGKHTVVFAFPASPLDGGLPTVTTPTDDIKAIMAAHGPKGTPLTVEVTESTDDFKLELP